MRDASPRDARRIEKARTLLRPAVAGATGCWADLGCGDGVFTYLLGQMLGPGSEIYAVDRDAHALRQLARNLAAWDGRVATVHPVHADFTQTLALPPLDGMVMANSLHFVQQKEPVLRRLAQMLKPGGRLVVVEYNTNRGNYAVPHPLDETTFLILAAAVGLRHVSILVKVPSSFLGEMYTAMGIAGGTA